MTKFASAYYPVHRYRIEMFGGISEWFGPAPRRWVRTISRKVFWMRKI